MASDTHGGVVNTWRDRVRGMFATLALGDALGAPHEMRRGAPLGQYTGEAYLSVVSYNRFTKKERRTAVGQVTDDTEMTLALARVLARDGAYLRDSALGAYMAWANSRCPSLGRNTRALFLGVRTKRGYEARRDRLDLAQMQSNGALMRCSPLALLEGEECVTEDCSLSNPNTTSIDACRVHVHALRLALAGERDILPRLLAIQGVDAQVHAVVQEAVAFRRDRPREVEGASRGWCLHALWCSLVSLHFSRATEAIDYIVRLGGDTDTNASIAGSLLGARLGYEAVHEERPGVLDTVLACDTTTGDVPRPVEYTPHDLDELVSALEKQYRK